MTLTINTLSRPLLRLVIIGAAAAFAAGCGSGNSTTTDDPLEPVSNPGMIDANLDGFVDDDDDLTGDGVVDVEDQLLYAELNPEVTDPDDPTMLLCDGESRNDSWVDNCILNIGGVYATSSYTQGVQRILWCLGYGQGVADINTFADGILGSSTETAIEEYQTENDLVSDGVVGSATWPQLRDSLADPVDFDADFNSFSVQSATCEDQIQFYQRKVSPFDWLMAATPGSNIKVNFSIDDPL